MNPVTPNRRHRQSVTEGGEQDSYFVAISDLMTGILFIFILLLTGVAIGSRSAEADTSTQRESLEATRTLNERLTRELASAHADLAEVRESLARGSAAEAEAREVAKRIKERLEAAQTVNQTLQTANRRLIHDLDSARADLSAVRENLARISAAETEAREEAKRIKGTYDAEQQQLIANKDKRTKLLRKLAAELRAKNYDVVADEEEGVLRLPDDLLFPEGTVKVGQRGGEALRALAALLEREIRCATTIPQDCPQGATPFLEAVLVEGHTDSSRVRPNENNRVFFNNWDLSTKRALEAFTTMTGSNPALKDLVNTEGRSIFGISGYADGRAVAPNNTGEGRERNRRIDLRFLLSGTGQRAGTR